MTKLTVNVEIDKAEFLDSLSDDDLLAEMIRRNLPYISGSIDNYSFNDLCDLFQQCGKARHINIPLRVYTGP